MPTLAGREVIEGKGGIIYFYLEMVGFSFGRVEEGEMGKILSSPLN